MTIASDGVAMSQGFRINVGCGQTPTPGWRNFDNSLSLRLAKAPLLSTLLHRAQMIQDPQFEFIEYARQNNIEYGDVTAGLPLTDGSCDVVYSSHMVEHLDRSEAERYLKEAFRVLRSGGMIRTVVPDIKKYIQRYNESGDADAFMESTFVCMPKPTSLLQRFKHTLIGARHHHWMYDGESLARLHEQCGFVEAKVLPPGETGIPDPGALDLYERDTESVYVEARKP